MADGLDERAVSESAGVAILVGFTLVVTASVGISVLVVDDDPDGVNANFEFEYQGEASRLLITHTGGDTFEAGNLLIEGDSRQHTWAELRGMDASENVSEGDLVQLSNGGVWNDGIRRLDTIYVYYTPEEGNRTQLAAWNE